MILPLLVGTLALSHWVIMHVSAPECRNDHIIVNHSCMRNVLHYTTASLSKVNMRLCKYSTTAH